MPSFLLSLRASFLGGGAGSLLLAACIDTTPPPLAESVPTVAVDPNVRLQEIRGFGASSAWTAPTLSDELADALFSVETGIGLSLLRIQIKPSGESTELGTVDAAVARGAAVWAAPWSPPAGWKSNGSTQNGGRLLDEYYDDWATRLADFAASMQARGTPLLGISAQNEPDFEAAWDTCEFTPEELGIFVGDYLGPALGALEPPVPVIAPESANWGSIERYSEALLGHESAGTSILAFATHGYGGDSHPARAVPAIFEANGELWLTEVSDEVDDVPDPGMGSALRVSRTIHTDLTVGSVSAWHYWWLLPRGDVDDTNAALAGKDLQLTKRAFALGHYAKFVRPGHTRVQATERPAERVTASAYVAPDDAEIVVVLTSERDDALEHELRIEGRDITAAALFTTDETRSLEPSSALLSDGAVTLTLPARSLVTAVLQTNE